MRITQIGTLANNFLLHEISKNTNNLLDMLNRKLADEYGEINSNSFKINGEIELKGNYIPNLILNGNELTNNFTAIDAFAKLTQAQATIFTRMPSGEFIRISTSLRDSNGNRLIGTKIDS